MIFSKRFGVGPTPTIQYKHNSTKQTQLKELDEDSCGVSQKEDYSFFPSSLIT